jgi:phosphatidylserine decarboxylase
LERGQRLGLIMFGSRVDLFLPPGSKIDVVEGQKVRGGETILGRFL